MPNFDQQAAKTQLDNLIRDVQRLRDGITRDIIEYNYGRYPDNEEEESYQRADMRKHLRTAMQRTEDLISELE